MKSIQKFYITVTTCFYVFHSIINDFALARLGTNEKLTMKVNQGKLRGQEFESVLTKEPYYGFLGIPYAKPPLGELRFQPAEPPDPWEGVYDATHERKWCLQVDPLLHKFGAGSEDCLHLNVFTPEIPDKMNASKQVMVFIHGGAFRRAAGTKALFSPDYLMKRDVIIVMMNYRLLAFGFFNLGLPECPGNAGLKDQLMALKWVKQNIAKFGGNPEHITIFGESAGSTSVYYHLISPLSKGLFTKAIMQSGTALNPWAVTFDPFQQAFEIGKRCGFRGNDTKELLSYMKKLPADDIVSASIKYIDDFKEIYPARVIAIAPSIEKAGANAFLPDWPSNLAKIATPIPTIFGVNNKEGMLLFTAASDNAVEKISDDFPVVLKDNFKIPKDALKELSSKVQKLYFGDKKVGKHTLDEIVDLYTDVIFFHSYEALKFLINSTSPSYIYEFAYNGQMNLYTKQINLSHHTKLKGASHADELFYLFYPEKIPMLPKLDHETINVINNMTLMWTNFAKTGNPTGDVEWKASTINAPQYLSIKEALKMVRGTFYGNRLLTLKNTVDPLIEPGSRPYEIF